MTALPIPPGATLAGLGGALSDVAEVDSGPRPYEPATEEAARSRLCTSLDAIEASEALAQRVVADEHQERRRKVWAAYADDLKRIEGVERG